MAVYFSGMQNTLASHSATLNFKCLFLTIIKKKRKIINKNMFFFVILSHNFISSGYHISQLKT